MNVSDDAFLKSSRGHVTSLVATRSGQLIVYMMGSRMSGQPSCASTLLSEVSIIECTMLCGWMTMSMSS